MSTFYTDALTALATMEESTEGKTQEVVHALAYAYGSGRTTSTLEMAIENDLPALVAKIEAEWDGEDSTWGILHTIKAMAL